MAEDPPKPETPAELLELCVEVARLAKTVLQLSGVAVDVQRLLIDQETEERMPRAEWLQVMQAISGNLDDVQEEGQKVMKSLEALQGRKGINA
jgi:hypothetical protein